MATEDTNKLVEPDYTSIRKQVRACPESDFPDVAQLTSVKIDHVQLSADMHSDEEVKPRLAADVISVSSVGEDNPYSSDEEEPELEDERAAASDDALQPSEGNGLFLTDSEDGKENVVKEDEDDDADDAGLKQLAEAKPRRSPSAAPATRGDVLVDLLNQPAEQHSTRVRSHAPFDALPHELKCIFLSYLDNEPHSVLCLSLVSRRWYKALNQGRSTEIDWQRRCNALGSLRRSPHCTLWRETFIRQLQKRCLSCFKKSPTAYGHLLDERPDWLKVCLDCQQLPGPWQTVSQFVAKQRCQDGNFLLSLPFTAVRNRHRAFRNKYLRYYLVSSLPGDSYDGHHGLGKNGFNSFLQKLKNVFIEEQFPISAYDNFKTHIRASQGQGKNPIRSERLMGMLLAIKNPGVRTNTFSEIVQEAVDYATRLTKFSEDFVKYEPVTPIDDFYKRSRSLLPFWVSTLKFRRTWADALITGAVTMSDLEEHLKMETKKTQDRMQIIAAREAGISRRKEQRARLKAIDVRGKSATSNLKRKRDSVTDVNTPLKKSKKKKKIAANQLSCSACCNAIASWRCKHKCCRTCCPGPCQKHKKTDRVDIYGTKKEEPDD